MRRVFAALLSMAVVLSLSACLKTGSGGVKSESVKSEAISSVDYNPESKDLTLAFERGTYTFDGVPQDVYDGLLASESKGAYFQKNIKGKYKAAKVK